MGDQVSLFASERRASAVFSECTYTTHRQGCAESCVGRLYRYTLRWPTGVDNERNALFVLANPSTADAEKPDPTVARCIEYARRWGFGWCVVVNARAWRATEPKDVPADPIAIGPRTDEYIRRALRTADLVVCGWGKLGGARGLAVLHLIRGMGKVPNALALNKDGSPQHPLYLSASLNPFPMEGR